MNETEIRDRVQQALGETKYPADLPRLIAARLDRPPRRGRPAIQGFVAALLALTIVATLIFIRLQSSSTLLPSSLPQPSPSSQPTDIGDVVIPQADLVRAQLSASSDLVTPLNLSSTSSGRVVTLIGAYADSARIVLFLRTMPDGSVPHAMVYDDSGFLNSGSTAGRGAIGDSYYILHAGPHAGNDGMAHLRVVVDNFDSSPPTAVQQRGNWTFSFPLRVVPSVHLRLGPPLTTVGSWTFTIESFEVTSSQVHFQAVIEGAAVEDLKQDTFSLTDIGGKALATVAYEAGTTVPKSQITSIPPRSTRVNIAWRRPAAGGPYMLAITGGGGHYVGGVNIPDPVTGRPVTKGTPLSPTDYPAATEAVTFDGAFSATVINGNPRACGAGSGGQGMLFEFGMWFQVDQAWYQVDFTTNPQVRQYSGPGTYDVRARIWPQDGSDIFDGTVQLTVTSDHYPGPYRGTVRGTMTWTGAATQPQTVSVTGGWSCTPGGQLGPG